MNLQIYKEKTKDREKKEIDKLGIRNEKRNIGGNDITKLNILEV